jgi:hypothetical protein
MELISVEERNKLIVGARDRLKLELRDRYAVDDVTFGAWRRGDAGTVRERMAATARRVATETAAGVTQRRIKVISEPPSEYMRFAWDISGPIVAEGEDIRWLPRRLTSSLLLPGNDVFVLDGAMAVFNVLDGDDGRAEQQLWTDTAVVERCREAFEAAWQVAVPHSGYRLA